MSHSPALGLPRTAALSGGFSESCSRLQIEARAMAAPILPDVLGPGLRIVFCGMAAGNPSARAGAYYAGSGNKFWPTLHRVGLTPHQLDSADFRSVLDYGVGLTDICKTESGPDASLSGKTNDPAAVTEKILRHRPAVLAFNGKQAALVYFGMRPGRRLDYGEHSHRIGDTAIHVLPSTSGSARGWWDETHWRKAAEAAKAGAT